MTFSKVWTNDEKVKTYMVVSTHLEIAVKLDHFPNFRDEHSKNIWNHDPPKSIEHLNPKVSINSPWTLRCLKLRSFWYTWLLAKAWVNIEQQKGNYTPQD